MRVSDSLLIFSLCTGGAFGAFAPTASIYCIQIHALGSEAPLSRVTKIACKTSGKATVHTIIPYLT